MITYRIHKIKPDKVEQFKAFARLVMSDVQAATKTIEEEQVSEEVWHYFTDGSGHYAVAIQSHTGATKPANRKREINQQFFDAIHECMDTSIPEEEVLWHLSTDGNRIEKGTFGEYTTKAPGR